MKIRKFLVGLLAALIALSSVAALADITIGVPDDTTNEARALRLLADNGIIELAEGAGETATKADVIADGIEIVEVQADQLVNQLTKRQVKAPLMVKQTKRQISPPAKQPMKQPTKPPMKCSTRAKETKLKSTKRMTQTSKMKEPVSPKKTQKSLRMRRLLTQMTMNRRIANRK